MQKLSLLWCLCVLWQIQLNVVELVACQWGWGEESPVEIPSKSDKSQGKPWQRNWSWMNLPSVNSHRCLEISSWEDLETSGEFPVPVNYHIITVCNLDHTCACCSRRCCCCCLLFMLSCAVYGGGFGTWMIAAWLHTRSCNKNSFPTVMSIRFPLLHVFQYCILLQYLLNILHSLLSLGSELSLLLDGMAFLFIVLRNFR